MRRKRKTKYIWLPSLGSDGDSDDTSSFSNSFPFSLAVLPPPAVSNSVGVGGIALFPILEDTPQEQISGALQNDDLNIADFIGTDYVIKRIVGKIHIGADQQATNSPSVLKVTAGLFVARADGAQPTLPVGALSTQQAIENYDPDLVDNIREPWIWRRTWLLGNQKSSGNAGATQAFVNVFPESTSKYGSVADGPHIDAKTGRRIRNDERLWFVATMRYPGDQFGTFSAFDTQANAGGLLDFRVLGALRRAKNRSNF